MARTEGIDARARLLATTAKRKGRSEEIRMMIKECGDDFPLVRKKGGEVRGVCFWTSNNTPTLKVETSC